MVAPQVQDWQSEQKMNLPTFHVQCRYRLSSGNGDTSSSEEDRYDRKEAKIYRNSGGGTSTSKAADTTAKMPAAKGNNNILQLIEYNA